MRAKAALPDSSKTNKPSNHRKLCGQEAVFWSAHALFACSGEALRLPSFAWDGRMIEGLWKILL
jgi:transposase